MQGTVLIGSTSNNSSASNTVALACLAAGLRTYPRIACSEKQFLESFSRWGAHTREGRRLSDSDQIDEFVRIMCLRGDEEATRVLDEHYLRPLFAGVLDICGTTEATETTLQRTREKLLLSESPALVRFQPGSFRSWLKVVVTRTALDDMRKERRNALRETELSEQLEQLALGPEKQMVALESRAHLRRALRVAVGRLSRLERRTLRLHLVSGWNITQIGRVLSIHRSTAARRLIVAKKKLTDLVGEELGTIAGPHQKVPSFLFELPTRLDLSITSLFASTGIPNLDRTDPGEPSRPEGSC